MSISRVGRRGPRQDCLKVSVAQSFSGGEASSYNDCKV